MRRVEEVRLLLVPHVRPFKPQGGTERSDVDAVVRPLCSEWSGSWRGGEELGRFVLLKGRGIGVREGLVPV